MTYVYRSARGSPGKSALFHNVQVDALAELQRGGERKLRQGQILFTANEPANGLYVVLSGSVRAFRENSDGHEQTIHVGRAGGLLAEVAVFDGGLYPSSTVAEEESELLFLVQGDVRRFLVQHRETAFDRVGSAAGNVTRRGSPTEYSRVFAERRLFSFLLSHTQLAARHGSGSGYMRITKTRAAGNDRNARSPHGCAQRQSAPRTVKLSSPNFAEVTDRE